MTILVTGAAGFIGFHTCRVLLESRCEVIGIDNLNDYYDIGLKKSRLAILLKEKNFTFHKMNIADRKAMDIFTQKYKSKITEVIHLAAQAGVRHSLENPHSYLESNLAGHLNILEMCRKIKGLNQLVYASSSSVYGSNKKIPFSVEDKTDSPVSLYAATKKSCELMTESYCHLYGFPAKGLRFFTVYGSYGRPDMAYFIFTKAIMEGKPIKLFNKGNMKRDFTYIDDVTSAIVNCMKKKNAGHKIYNIGNNKPLPIMDMVRIIEKETGHKAKIKMEKMQPGDVKETFADIKESARDLKFRPVTKLEKGLKNFVEWYRGYYL